MKTKWFPFAILVAIVALARVVIDTPAQGGQIGHEWLEHGSFPIGSRTVTLVDATRPTAPNGDYAGAKTRTLKCTVWYPAGDRALEALRWSSPPVAAGPHPLVIYSHGYMSFRSEGQYLAEMLASNGYIVVAADYPLTNYFSPGGPTLSDVVNQPKDVSFLIDTLLSWNGQAGNDFAGRVDPGRIVAMGLSLGGMTTELAAFHPKLRDPRLSAAVSLAGPSSMFGPAFFQSATVPFMMVAGDIDAIVDYKANAKIIPERAPRSTLVTIKGGTHVGFVGMSSTWLWWMSNPDRLGCSKMQSKFPKNADFLSLLGGPAEGLITPDPRFPCRDNALPPAIAPGRQHALTTMAVYSFLESRIDPDPGIRARANEFLVQSLARDNRDILVTLPHE